MLELREHQVQVIDALRDGFRNGHRAQLLYAPTGFGKTEVAIYLMKATAEKYKSAAMVLDRLVLVDQTSMRLTKYGINHGVFQSEHWKYDIRQRLQVCSAQTMERRNNFPDMDLIIVDECHITREQTTALIKANPNTRVIGLTATPFTSGLGDIYSNVVCGSTTQDLVEKKWLTPLKVYISKEIDMTGVKKIAGEWSPDQVTERGMKITGDIVGEWIKKTHEVFGRPRKTIVFCAGVAHGADLVEQFAQKGYNFVSISYKDTDEFKKEAIEDFAKPDTEIHGLIATDILTRGFDVPDVMIGVSARPFSKSLSSHIQQMGRVMRSHPDKEFALWLDHSGNYLRFREEWDDIYEVGVKTLNDKQEKTKKEPTEKVKKESKCPKCEALWIANSDTCSSCGFVRQKRNQVSSIAGELVELGSVGKSQKQEKQVFYSELLYIAKERNYNEHWASHKYREKFGVWPKGLEHNPVPPTLKTANWIKSKNIAWAKKSKRTSAVNLDWKNK
jgi:superfamily II DNA or RNA helicase